MGILKLSQIKQTLFNIDDLIKDLEETDGEIITNYDLYVNTSKLLEDEGLLTDKFKSMYDYISLVLMDDIKNDRDILKKIKKMHKNLELSDEEYLMHIKQVVNIVHSHNDMDNNINGLPTIVVVHKAYTAVYYFILIYSFEVCKQNKKVSIGTKQTTYGLLSNIEKYVLNSYSQERELIAHTLSALKQIPYKDLIKNIDAIRYASMIKYKTLCELTLTDSLLRNLLSKEEFASYCKALDISTFISNSLIQEIKEEEDCVELIPKFYDLLRHRAYLIPHCGISLVPTSIDVTLDVYERQYKGDNYLIILTKLNRANEFTGHTIINLNKRFMLNTFPYIYDIMSFLYTFYKLNDKALEHYGSEFAYDPKIYYSYDIIQFANAKKIAKGTANTYNDFTIEVPYYWKYKDKSKKYRALNKSQFLESIQSGGREIYISAFKRKLPKGFKPSSEAVKLAKVYCLDLEPGETLVSPHIREY